MLSMLFLITPRLQEHTSLENIVCLLDLLRAKTNVALPHWWHAWQVSII